MHFLCHLDGRKPSITRFGSLPRADSHHESSGCRDPDFAYTIRSGSLVSLFVRRLQPGLELTAATWPLTGITQVLIFVVWQPLFRFSAGNTSASQRFNTLHSQQHSPPEYSEPILSLHRHPHSGLSPRLFHIFFFCSFPRFFPFRSCTFQPFLFVSKLNGFIHVTSFPGGRRPTGRRRSGGPGALPVSPFRGAGLGQNHCVLYSLFF